VQRSYHVYFGTQTGHVIGLDTTGVKLFDVDLGAPVDCDPALTADANLIVGPAAAPSAPSDEGARRPACT
jgi:hypothetical protein